MPLPDDAREAGAQALGSVKRLLAGKVADLIQRDPTVAANAVEVGIIDQDWLEQPGDHPIRTATTVDMLQRLLSRSVEQKPSALNSLGLSAVQMLSMGAGVDDNTAATVPITIMFTDLEGFTRFTADFGDAAAIDLLHQHHRAVGPVIRSRGGRIVKRLGDGLLLSFPAPEAAVLAAVELVGSAPEPLRLRAGIHVGEAVVTHDDVIGHAVNVAARVTEAASGGETLVTEDVCRAVGDLPQVRFGKAHKSRLKGLPEPVRICRLEPVA